MNLFNSRQRQRIKANICKAAAVVLVLSMIITQTGCGDKEPVSKRDFCLDTSCEITIYDMNKKEAEELLDGAFDEIRRCEKLLSRTISGSDVDRINKAGGKPVEVSEETWTVIQAGLTIGDYSDGKFDITIGRVSKLWDFKSETPSLPKHKDIEAAIKTVDYKNIKTEVRQQNGKKKMYVSLDNPEAEIDLGGIAKGYIADLTGVYLKGKGVTSALINLGGNIVVIGDKPDGSAWNIGIERPYSDRTAIVGSVELRDATVATSGVYERSFEQDGRRYHHVLDPETGYPVETDLEAATVTASYGNSYLCDGLSTVCLMLGTEKAKEMIEELQRESPDIGLEAAFIDVNDDMTCTDGMKISPVEE